ncbi:MAG TPA: hypothetical protein VF138_02590 [Caulobacteraceae bacterium]
MLNIQWVNAWKRDDWKVEADAKAFWEKLGLISAEERERRVKELCAAGYLDGQLVVVSTVTVSVFPQFKARLGMYRCAVDPAYRRQDLAERISGYTRQVLEMWSVENPAEKLLGYGAIIQAPELMRKGLEPIWHDWGTDLVLAGYTQRGEQIRIGWFRHTRLEGAQPPAAEAPAGPSETVQ